MFKFAVGCVLVILEAGWCFSGKAADKPFRLYVEAEDCDGLQRFPYHNEDAPGWYAREANVRGYGAPGRSYFAAIHDSATQKTMAQRLAAPIPAGQYQAFVRVVGPGVNEDSVLEVAIGKTPVRFTWRYKGRRAKWLPGVPFTLGERADALTFIARKLGGSSHGALYMPLHNTMWVDTLYITSDLAESSPPDIVTERWMRAGVDPASIPPRQPHRADETGPNDPQTPAPLGPVLDEPILLQSFDGRKNLWPNSSFELGMNDGWASQEGPQGAHVFTDRDLCQENPYHGSYCLHLRGATPFSRPYRLAKAGSVTLSMYVRGDGQKVAAMLRKIPGRGDPDYKRGDSKFSVSLQSQGTAGPQWSRLTATGRLEAGWYYLALGGGEYFVDAVQLEHGEQATDYAPRAEVEGALRTGRIGNIVHDDEPKTLDLWLHHSGQQPRQAALRYRIVDVREQVVAQGTTEPLELRPGTTITRPVPVLPKLRGMFSVSFAVQGRHGTEGETAYLVMPRPPKTATRHELGGNMNPAAESELAVQSRLGLKWVLTCKSRQLAAASEGAHPKPGVWNWRDEEAALPGKYGMTLHPGLWIGRIPEFMREPAPRQYRALRSAGGPPVSQPKMDLWKEHVAKVVEHYQEPIHWWCIDDEVEGSWDPAMYAAYVAASCDTAHRAFPKVKIGYSGWVDFQEELLHFLPAGKLDFFGSSTFDMHYWESRKTAHFAQRYGKPFFCYGVGGRPPMHTMYHSSYHFLAPYGKAARMARRVVNLLLVQDLKCAGHYAAIFCNRGTHYAMNKPLCDYDGTPLPWGATFGCLGTLLADAQPVDHLRLGNTDCLAHLFRTGQRCGFATYATCVPDYDHLYRPAEREIRGLRMPCAPGSVEVLDMYWNPHPGARWEAGVLKIDLGEEPVFVLDKSLGEAGLRRLIAESRRPPKDVDITAALVPARDGSVDVEIRLKNNSTSPLSDVQVDLRHATDPFTTAGQWLLARPCVDVGALAPGVEKTVRCPTVLDGRAPYEDGRVRVHLHAGNGFQAASDHGLWMIPAARAKTPVDASLEQWRNRPAAWLAYEWSSMPMGRHEVQFYEKAEHFSYPTYRLDARAMIWTGYDDANLYVAVRLEDDQPMLAAEDGEKVRVVLTAKDKTTAVDLHPLADGTVKIGTVPPACPGVRAWCAQVEEVIHDGADWRATRIKPVHVVASIPWQCLGIVPKSADLVGFDLFWTDVDREDDKTVAGTLRWAGGAEKNGYVLLK